MQEKVLSTISEDVLSKVFNFNGTDMVYKDYLIQEVFPYVDLNKDTITLKNGLIISMKEFIEEAVLYTCQNKYRGVFSDFAKEFLAFHVVSNKKENNNRGMDNNGRNFVFFENYDGPKYIVNIDGNNISFAYKDGTFNVVMDDPNDQKDFLLHIKELDLDLFTHMLENQETFRKYVHSFDEFFVKRLLSGTQKKVSFDQMVDSAIDEISFIIKSVDNGELSKLDELNQKNVKFNVSELPRFNSKKCINDVLKRCSSFYSEFTSDVDSLFKMRNITEKTEYVIDEYLVKIVDDIFTNYVNLIADKINNDLSVTVNGDFISDRLDEILLNLREVLKTVFVNINSSSLEARDVYINIALDDVANDLIDYELLIDGIIDSKVKKEVSVDMENTGIRRVS